jgi:hypothetical protein
VFLSVRVRREPQPAQLPDPLDSTPSPGVTEKGDPGRPGLARSPGSARRGGQPTFEEPPLLFPPPQRGRPRAGLPRLCYFMSQLQAGTNGGGDGSTCASSQAAIPRIVVRCAEVVGLARRGSSRPFTGWNLGRACAITLRPATSSRRHSQVVRRGSANRIATLKASVRRRDVALPNYTLPQRVEARRGSDACGGSGSAREWTGALRL